jgi:hypothetical protein
MLPDQQQSWICSQEKDMATTTKRETLYLGSAAIDPWDQGI